MQKFYGDIKEYPAFIGSFKAAVDSQPISKLEKLTYLFSLLKGEAKKSIQGFATLN